MSTTLKSTMQLSQFQTLLSKTLYWGVLLSRRSTLSLAAGRKADNVPTDEGGLIDAQVPCTTDLPYILLIASPIAQRAPPM